jgi:hypothetical protein
MNTVTQRLRAALLLLVIAFGILLGGTQRVEAAIPTAFSDSYYPYYNVYYNNYLTWSGYYDTYHVTSYHYNALAYLYYYYAGLYGDEYCYYYDSLGNKSDKHLSGSNYSSFTYNDYEANYYAYYGDYYWRLYHSVSSR